MASHLATENAISLTGKEGGGPRDRPRLLTKPSSVPVSFPRSGGTVLFIKQTAGRTLSQSSDVYIGRRQAGHLLSGHKVTVPKKKMTTNARIGSLATISSPLDSVSLFGETHARVSMLFAVKILNTTRGFSYLMFKTFRLYQYRGRVSIQAFLLLGRIEKGWRTDSNGHCFIFNCKLLALKVKGDVCCWGRKRKVHTVPCAAGEVLLRTYSPNRALG